jgi:hypothetical protein
VPHCGTITLWNSLSPGHSQGAFTNSWANPPTNLLRTIQGELEIKPDRGAMVPGLGGVRRKRGGYRYLYLYLQDRGHIHLLILLDKNEQEDASEEQRKQIREWVALIKKSSGG